MYDFMIPDHYVATKERTFQELYLYPISISGLYPGKIDSKPQGNNILTNNFSDYVWHLYKTPLYWF